MAKEEQKQNNDFEMEYRMLGNTGLKVSILGYGLMTLESTKQAIEILTAVRKYGINFFDNAEFYGNPCGSAEKYFGEALKELMINNPNQWRRSDLVITTKLFFGTADGKQPHGFKNRIFGKNEIGLSFKHLLEGMKDSLNRLNLEYVDIVYAHRYDTLTPMIEIVRGFNAIINKGQALYWGTSMWPTHKWLEAYYIAKLNNLIPPIVEQPVYNMFNRDIVEFQYLDLFKEPYKMATTIWSPLDSGILSGKYLNNEIPKDSRLEKHKDYFKKEDIERKNKSVQILKDTICKELNVTMVNLALGWVLKNKNVSVCLLGATKVSQLEQNIGAIDCAKKLNKELMERIDKILDNKPKGDALNTIWRPVETSMIE